MHEVDEEGVEGHAAHDAAGLVGHLEGHLGEVGSGGGGEVGGSGAVPGGAEGDARDDDGGEAAGRAVEVDRHVGDGEVVRCRARHGDGEG